MDVRTRSNSVVIYADTDGRADGWKETLLNQLGHQTKGIIPEAKGIQPT